MEIDDAIRKIIREEVRQALEPLLESLQSGGKITRRAIGRDPSGDFLTVAEAAEVTHRHPEAIYLALQAKELKGAQRTKGGRWLIRRSDIALWVVGERGSA